jgi:membrane protease YdiL (CAAX protease family)
MKDFIKTYWKTLLFFTLAGLIGGFFTGIDVLDSYSPELQQQLISELDAAGLGQFPANLVMGVISACQAAGYGLVLGAIGIILGKKTGLWKDEKTFTKKPVLLSLAIGIFSGLVLILSDLLFFWKYSEVIMDSYAAKPTVVYILAAIIYGGVIEEVMLRLFLMTLLAFILHKLFEKTSDKPTARVLVTANVIAAFLFAAGHMPATLSMLGSTPLIIFRCFLLNGGVGLLFGYLYRKYGLRYAMIGHAGCHIVSKLIWILFI